MKITAINGSAKGERSNSREIIAMIQSMVGEDKPIEVVSQIAQFRKPDDAALRAMAESDVLVIASSLYVDGLPASLMTLLDRYSAYLAGIGAPGASLTSGASQAPRAPINASSASSTAAFSRASKTNAPSGCSRIFARQTDSNGAAARVLEPAR